MPWPRVRDLWNHNPTTTRVITGAGNRHDAYREIVEQTHGQLRRDPSGVYYLDPVIHPPEGHEAITLPIMRTIGIAAVVLYWVLSVAL